MRSGDEGNTRETVLLVLILVLVIVLIGLVVYFNRSAGNTSSNGRAVENPTYATGNANAEVAFGSFGNVENTST